MEILTSATTLQRVEWWLPGAWREGEIGRCWSSGTKFQLCKLNTGNLIYNNVSIVNNVVLYIWNLLMGQILNVIIMHTQKQQLCDEYVNLLDSGEYLTMFTYIIKLYILNRYNFKLSIIH